MGADRGHPRDRAPRAARVPRPGRADPPRAPLPREPVQPDLWTVAAVFQVITVVALLAERRPAARAASARRAPRRVRLRADRARQRRAVGGPRRGLAARPPPARARHPSRGGEGGAALRARGRAARGCARGRSGGSTQSGCQLDDPLHRGRLARLARVRVRRSAPRSSGPRSSRSTGQITVGQFVLVLTPQLAGQRPGGEPAPGTSRWFVRTYRAVGRLVWFGRYADRVAAETAAGRAARPRRTGCATASASRASASATRAPSAPILERIDLHLPAGSDGRARRRERRRQDDARQAAHAGSTTRPRAGSRSTASTSASFDVTEWRARTSASFQDFGQLKLARARVGRRRRRRGRSTPSRACSPRSSARPRPTCSTASPAGSRRSSGSSSTTASTSRPASGRSSRSAAR